MTTQWSVNCWNCDEGTMEYGCNCMEDTCVCAEPTPPKCDICSGKGFYIVNQLTDDNCETAIPLD